MFFQIKYTEQFHRFDRPANPATVGVLRRPSAGDTCGPYMNSTEKRLQQQYILERVRSKTAVLMYKATHGNAPSYLSQLVRVADLPGRRSLRSARTNRLLVPSVKLSTVGGRAFPVAGPTIWDSLPDSVISAPSLSIFRHRLKTFLFQASFPDIITDPR